MKAVTNEGDLVEFELLEKIALAEKRRLIYEFIDNVKSFLTNYYKPVNDPTKATFHYTTIQIFDQLQELFPSPEYSSLDVSIWLKEFGFTYYDFGEMKLEWLFKKA